MKIAIIGGIGSGKSEVLKVAREMGAYCLSADEINSELLTSPEYIAELAKAFPNAVVNGVVNRTALANSVFSVDEERKKLNAIAHPRILARIREANENPLVVEMPLMVECGAQSLFDEIVLVLTPLELRLERLEVRGISRDNAILRMRAQSDESELKAVATHVIDNGSDIYTLRQNAKAVFAEILKNKF